MSSRFPFHSYGGGLEKMALAEAKILSRVAFDIPNFLLMTLLCEFGLQSSIAALLSSVLKFFQTTDIKQNNWLKWLKLHSLNIIF
jgi:hypothetical protein